MPIKTWSDGNIPTASDFNTQFRDQVVSTVTSSTHPTGTNGQLIYETDTNKYQAFDGAVFNEVGKLGAWNAWSPTLSQSATVTYTVNHAAYFRWAKMVICHCNLSCTSSGTANNPVQVTLPVTATGANSGGGTGSVFDSSAALIYPGIVVLNATTTARMRDATQAVGNLYSGQTGAAFSAALASGDSVDFFITYEAA